MASVWSYKIQNSSYRGTFRWILIEGYDIQSELAGNSSYPSSSYRGSTVYIQLHRMTNPSALSSRTLRTMKVAYSRDFINVHIVFNQATKK